MTMDTLLADARAFVASAEFKQAVLRGCREIDPVREVSRLNTNIHPDDQMFLHSLRSHGEVDVAASQYFAVAAQQFNAMRQVMALTVGNRADASVLDFACGFGRLLRFLELVMERGSMAASELQADALDFVGREFRVATFPSTPDPADFRIDGRFDFIWVASLFSHLPRPLFDAWLSRLLELLTPRGVLCFSVRDIGLLPGGATLDDAAFLYQPESENADLGSDIYGTTYAGEGFVRDVVATALGRDAICRRLPRALANE